jgi:hypothetical protein
MPILPTAMPDEFVLGYWGRIHALNLHSSPNQTMEALVENFALPLTRIQRVEALALAAQKSTPHFVQNHTLIPALAAISQHFEGAAHGDVRSPGIITKSWKRLQKAGAYFCPECSAEQKSQWGFSYWMRSHQLLGVDWCPRHWTPLIACDDQAFLRGTPYFQENLAPPQQTERGQTYWPILERYSQIALAYLGTTRRIGVQDASKRLRPIAASRNINARGISGSRYLSDIAMAQLPGWWLEKLFPSIANKRTNTPFPPLDNTVLSGFAMPHAYALAMALLYESSEEALAGMPH